MTNKIQFEELRTGPDGLDTKFVALRQQLNQAFFGSVEPNGGTFVRLEDGWRAGVSKPFLAWDVQPTLQESRELHGFLNGAISHLYMLMLHQINVTRGIPIAVSEYSPSWVASSLWLGKQTFMPAQELRTGLVLEVEGRFPGKKLVF